MTLLPGSDGPAMHAAATSFVHYLGGILQIHITHAAMATCTNFAFVNSNLVGFKIQETKLSSLLNQFT